MKNNYEIERKFLIALPDIDKLSASCCEEQNILQIYLAGDEGITSRVRRIIQGGRTKYIYTFKKRISMIKCIEEEREITYEEYENFLKKSDKNARPIEKTRYKLPWDGHIFEIDIYPFWKKTAVMEIELVSEDEKFTMPPDLKIMKEVTDDVRYKNFSLAKHIPLED